LVPLEFLVNGQDSLLFLVCVEHIGRGQEWATNILIKILKKL